MGRTLPFFWLSGRVQHIVIQYENTTCLRRITISHEGIKKPWTRSLFMRHPTNKRRESRMAYTGRCCSYSKRELGYGNSLPSMHSSCGIGSRTLCQETSRRKTATRHRLLFGIYQTGSCPQGGNRKSSWNHVKDLEKARSDNSTLSVWRKCFQENLSVVERTSCFN